MLRLKFMRHTVLASSVIGIATVFACGPFFPEDALDQPRGILQPPLFHFQSELNRLPLPDALAKHAPGTPAFTLDLEMAEMEEIMAARMPAQDEREAWFLRYRVLRRSMIHYGDDSEQKMQKGDAAAVVKWENLRRDLAEIITPLPEDVRLYLEGAAAWLDTIGTVSEKPENKAREIWQRLLALPAEQRTWRSTWAAWMLFRTAPHEEQGHWLSQTRKLNRAGCKDCLHLGIESAYILGRPGSDYAERTEVSAAEWRRVAMLRAMLGLNRADDNLRHDRWMQTEWSEEYAREVSADVFLRRVQMLHLIEVAQSGTGWETGAQIRNAMQDDLPRWLASFEQAQIKDQQEAMLLAWICYNAAQFNAARRWLVLAPADDVNALSLRGKLAAMRGERLEAEQHLARMAKLLPTTEDHARVGWERDRDNEIMPLTKMNYQDVRRHKLLADCGVAQVARNDFAGALQTFLRTDYWRDAAYIAERLLSVEELLTLSRSGKLPRLQKMVVPELEPPNVISVGTLEDKYGGGWSGPEGIKPFTYLVARRLAREGFYKEAARLLPDDLALALNRYAEELQRGNNQRRPKAERAAALWTAAQIERQLGMELFGFETGPDHAVCGGSFELNNFAELRSQKHWKPYAWFEPGGPEQEAMLKPVLPATADELWRARHYGPQVEKRFHYRYIAADLAWRAAGLMRDNDEQTARVLGITGNWLKHRDPKAADRFYKAMVNRNPSVPLAQAADQKRWLPEIEWSFDLELKNGSSPSLRR